MRCSLTVVAGGLAALGALCLPAAAESISDPASLGIAGLRIGMSPLEAAGALDRLGRQSGRRFTAQAQRGRLDTGVETARAITAVAGDAARDGGAQRIVVLFTRHAPARAYAILRGVAEAPAGRTTLAAHVGRLRDAYGPGFGEPSHEAERPVGDGLLTERSFAWVYDAAHRKVEAADPDSAARAARCEAHDGDDPPAPFAAGDALGADMPAPARFAPGCGVTYQRRLFVDAGAGQVTRWFEELVSDELGAGEQDAPAAAPAPTPPRAPAATVAAEAAPGASREQIAAAFDTAQRLDTGHGAPQDQAAALAWYRRAAELGNVVAMFNIGVMLDSGRGTPVDRAEAARWYARAAAFGHGRAEYNLALLCEAGDGVPRDTPRAMALFRAAAAHGIPAAEARLARPPDPTGQARALRATAARALRATAAAE